MLRASLNAAHAKTLPFMRCRSACPGGIFVCGAHRIAAAPGRLPGCRHDSAYRFVRIAQKIIRIRR
ncbi:hypothetical protein C7S14_0588 [Burkholderia cepacia]|nr:hypothetical protein C7S14_0588 [Burkholderia cepacia]